MLGTPVLLPMSLVTLGDIYFPLLLPIQHRKQWWQWRWMSLAILAPRELKISPFTASVKSGYALLPRTPELPPFSDRLYGIGVVCSPFRDGEGGFLGNTTGNQHPTGHAPWPEGTVRHDVKVVTAQDSYLRTDCQGPRPQTSQRPRLVFHTQDTHLESICSEYPG